ncbi:MAG: hypothetical protein OXN89_01820 [Bryobacterales bacterium]|nr:hypothetical protein [Bryobacterales bacterium]
MGTRGWGPAEAYMVREVELKLPAGLPARAVDTAKGATSFSVRAPLPLLQRRTALRDDQEPADTAIGGDDLVAVVAVRCPTPAAFDTWRRPRAGIEWGSGATWTSARLRASDGMAKGESCGLPG